MTAQAFSPKLKEVIINGQHYRLVAFYYPGSDTKWDSYFQGQFLANFYPCKITLTIKDITAKDVTASFNCAEAAFQATKWWSHPVDRSKFEAATWPSVTGKEAYRVKQGLHNPDDDEQTGYAGLGQLLAMKTVLTQKFSDPVLKQGLLLTKDAYLLEHNEAKGRDPGGWSDNHDGTGSNKLGLTLMEVREFYGGVGAPSGKYTVADFTAHAEEYGQSVSHGLPN